MHGIYCNAGVRKPVLSEVEGIAASLPKITHPKPQSPRR